MRKVVSKLGDLDVNSIGEWPKIKIRLRHGANVNQIIRASMSQHSPEEKLMKMFHLTRG